MSAQSSLRLSQSRENGMENRMLATLVMSTALFSSVELILALVSRSALPDPIRLFFVRNSLWMLMCASAVPVAYSVPLRARGPVVLAVAAAINLFLMMQFRGAWIWVGTFDSYEQSAKPWMMAMALGVVLGYLALLVPSWRSSQADTGEKTVNAWLVALCALTIATGAVSLLAPMQSEFAPTRFLGLSALVVAAVAVRRLAR
jgi:hypothetical protein